MPCAKPRRTQCSLPRVWNLVFDDSPALLHDSTCCDVPWASVPTTHVALDTPTPMHAVQRWATQVPRTVADVSLSDTSTHCHQSAKGQKYRSISIKEAMGTENAFPERTLYSLLLMVSGNREIGQPSNRNMLLLGTAMSSW